MRQTHEMAVFDGVHGHPKGSIPNSETVPVPLDRDTLALARVGKKQVLQVETLPTSLGSNIELTDCA